MKHRLSTPTVEKTWTDEPGPEVQLVRRPGGLPWWFALVAVPALLTAVLLATRGSTIEADLKDRSEEALRNAGVGGVVADFAGRDASLRVPLGVSTDRARLIVEDVEGVRVVSVDGLPPAPNERSAEATPAGVDAGPGPSWLFAQLWFLLTLAFVVGAAVPWVIARVALPHAHSVEIVERKR